MINLLFFNFLVPKGFLVIIKIVGRKLVISQKVNCGKIIKKINRNDLFWKIAK